MNVLEKVRGEVLAPLSEATGAIGIDGYRRLCRDRDVPLQGEVDELQEQLAYKKQRLKQVTKQSDSNPNQPVKQRTSAKACKPQKKNRVETRSSNCVSGRKVVK